MPQLKVFLPSSTHNLSLARLLSAARTSVMFFTLATASMASANNKSMPERETSTDESRSSSVRVLIYGDSGDGSSAQRRVGEAMADRNDAMPASFAVSMGDNQYVPTRTNVWRDIFEIPYARLISRGLRMYQTVGNHDMEENRLADQLAYSRSVDALRRDVGGFVMPAENYVIQKDMLRWIVINVSNAIGTVRLTDATMAFARREICAPFDGWKVVSMHYPFWSTGPRSDNLVLQARLLPLFEDCPVDFIFSGHEHHAEWFLPWKWTFFGIVGNGHEVRTARMPSMRESLFRLNELGFAELVVDRDTARVRFFDDDGKIRYFTSMQKRPAMWADTWKQVGRRLYGRVLPTEGVATNQIEAEVGFTKVLSDPLASRGTGSDQWIFYPARRNNRIPQESEDLIAFAAEIPDSWLNGGFAMFRYRYNSNSPWIYGDRSEGSGLHGNYDGIQLMNALQINARN